MPRNIVLTGASGFIGGALLKALLAQGDRVLALVRTPSKLQVADGLTIVACDLENIVQETAQAVIACKPDALVHTAWLGTENTDRNNPEFIEANKRSCMRLFEIAVSAQCRQFIGFGSQAEYSPGIEENISETSAASPDSNYGASKLAMGQSLQKLCGEIGMGFVWLRLFASYGNNYHATYVMPYVIDCFRKGQIPVMKTPHAVWDYIHVDDVVGATLAALGQPKVSGIFNLATGDGISIGDIALQLAVMSGFEDKMELRRQIDAANDVPTRRVADISAIKFALGWKPLTTLTQGLERCL